MPLVSLVMIVKNEGEGIARCLESAKQIADEVVIADTGSTDGTREVAARYADALLDYEWADDFAAARNHALARARGDWILHLDADEALSARDPGALTAQLLKEETAPLLSVPMRHYYGAEPPSEWRAHLSHAPRIFRNRAGIAYAGRIHERPEGADASEPARGVEIRHYGYLDARAAEKRGRNLAMLLRERESRPDDPWTLGHIAAELSGAGRLREAHLAVNWALTEFLRKGQLPPAMLYKLKYETLLSAGEYAAAHPAVERAIALYPDYADLHFCKGLALLHLDRAREAAEAFRHCLVLGDANPKYLTTLGVGGFLALCALGACHERMGEADAAREARRQAAAICPEAERLAQPFLAVPAP